MGRTIAQLWLKIKSHQETILSTALIILLAIFAFGLGRWSKIAESKPPVTISQPEGEELAGEFVASRNGAKYYPKVCAAAERIKAENRIYFATATTAEAAGYTLSSACR